MQRYLYFDFCIYAEKGVTQVFSDTDALRDLFDTLSLLLLTSPQMPVRSILRPPYVYSHLDFHLCWILLCLHPGERLIAKKMKVVFYPGPLFIAHFIVYTLQAGIAPFVMVPIIPYILRSGFSHFRRRPTRMIVN